MLGEMYETKLDYESGNQEPDSADCLLDRDYLKRGQQSWLDRHMAWIHGALHALSVVTILALAIPLFFKSQVECWNRFNSYSSCSGNPPPTSDLILTRSFHLAPISDFIGRHPYVPTTINNSMLFQSPFTGQPSENVEQAWRAITQYRILSLTADEVERLGYPASSALFPTAAGSEGSSSRYPVMISGNHQLHCLHIIYQSHHLDYYTSRRELKENHPDVFERHFEHCVDFIRQRLMCHYDMSVTPHLWVEGHQAPLPGPTITEKCVDWPALNGWMRTHQPRIVDDFEWEIPDDAVILDMSKYADGSYT